MPGDNLDKEVPVALVRQKVGGRVRDGLSKGLEGFSFNVKALDVRMLDEPDAGVGVEGSFHGSNAHLEAPARRSHYHDAGIPKSARE